MTRLRHLSAALVAAGLISPAYAQSLPALAQAIAPDAGRLNRELQEPVQPPAPSLELNLPAPTQDVVQPGGPQVLVNEIRFVGNTVLTTQALTELVQPALGKQHDLAGLYAIADQVTQYYRSQGYSFAKVFVGEGAFKAGVLVLEVVEGQYGQTSVVSDDAELAAQATPFLQGFKQGQPIYAPALERQMLILDDQPGVEVSPVIKPAVLPGQGDLDVTVSQGPKVSGNVGLSNHGNRYTGYLQARANVFINSLFQFGDQLSLSGLQSDADLQYGALNYSMPVGTRGLRATAGYSVTDYELGREFSNLQASGDAEIASVGMSYPFIRSRALNVTGSVLYQDKDFFDEQRSVNSQVRRSSETTSLLVSFDRVDSAGVTYGQLDYTQGDFKGPVPDTARTNGNFTRVNYDLVRQHVLGKRLSAFVRANGQVARDNLDSSESYSVGGVNGVRAYPTGEATGDEGRLLQLELRYRHSEAISPFVFYDVGSIDIEHNPTVAGNNGRSLSGFGLGVRYQDGPLALELMAANRINGGAAQTDPKNDSVQFWFTVRYAF